MIHIDGSQGEGGGQVLRTSLALSLVTGQPFAIRNIRAGRRKPGLLRQHMAAVRAAGEIGAATVEGNEIGSGRLLFRPGAVRPGEYSFAVGTAGSAALVLQAVLPALLVAPGPSRLVLEGGTHNPFAPPFEFLARSFLPLVSRMGPEVTARLDRHGFYPAGGGGFTVEIEPTTRLRRLELLEPGELRGRRIRGLVSRLPPRIAETETRVVRQELGWPEEVVEISEVRSPGPGNAVMAEIETENATEVFTGFGRKGVPAPQVAMEVVDQVRAYQLAGVAVGQYLADQLLIPLAMAGGGRFRTVAPTPHMRTNAEVIARFLPAVVRVERDAEHSWLATVEAAVAN